MNPDDKLTGLINLVSREKYQSSNNQLVEMVKTDVQRYDTGDLEFVTTRTDYAVASPAVRAFRSPRSFMSTTYMRLPYEVMTTELRRTIDTAFETRDVTTLRLVQHITEQIKPIVASTNPEVVEHRDTFIDWCLVNRRTAPNDVEQRWLDEHSYAWTS